MTGISLGLDLSGGSQLLLEADVPEADLMVALTNNDQVNILASVMAKRLGCKSNLSLINNPTFQDITKSVGIDACVNPSSVTISRVLQHVRRGRIRWATRSWTKGASSISWRAPTVPPLATPAPEEEIPITMPESPLAFARRSSGTSTVVSVASAMARGRFALDSQRARASRSCTSTRATS